MNEENLDKKNTEELVEETEISEEIEKEEDTSDSSEEDKEQNLENSVNENKKNNKHYLKIFLAVFLAASLAGIVALFAQNIYIASKSVSGSRVVATKEEKDTQETTINAVSKAKDAVVSVVNYQRNSKNSLLERFNKSNNDLKAASNGSGVIYKKENNNAYVVTNEHVISGAEKINVILSDGTAVDAELVGYDIWTDLAVLKISAEKVSVIMNFADSDKVAVGETALAIGSPLGVSLSNSVTKGIISAVERQIPIDIDKDGNYDWYQTVFQTDAAINPGNSGGALINHNGELIGINELKISNVSQSTAAEGIGFVIPSNEVKIITEALEKTGKIERPALGVQLISISSLNPNLLKETINYNGNKGVVIKSVEKGSSAELAGLQQYDVITKLNDTNIDGVADLRKYIFEKTKIGQKIVITYYREGKEYKTDLLLGKLH